MRQVDKKGRSFSVAEHHPGDDLHLKRMYDDFVPKARFQGMPPEEESVRCRWIDRLVENGLNFLAWGEGRVVGHVVLMSDMEKGDAEYLIFVDKSHRGAGVGKALTEAAIDGARCMGIRRIWLTVDAYNFAGIRLYRKMGFQFQDDGGSATERTMALTLRWDRRP